MHVHVPVGYASNTCTLQSTSMYWACSEIAIASLVRQRENISQKDVKMAQVQTYTCNVIL